MNRPSSRQHASTFEVVGVAAAWLGGMIALGAVAVAMQRRAAGPQGAASGVPRGASSH